MCLQVFAGVQQYDRLTRTGTYLNFGRNFSFLIILPLILGLFSNLMFQKSYIYVFAGVCRCTNGIKRILMESFYYSSSQYMKLK